MRMGSLAVLMFLLPTSFAPAKEMAADCEDLDRCMAWLDARVPTHGDGRHDELCDVAARELPRFGDAAKQALLAKLEPQRTGWGNLAACALQDFPGLSEADVPRLRASLRVRHGGWEANALGRIASDSAIEALMEDLPNGAASQTGFELQKLGARSLPYLLDDLTRHASQEPYERQDTLDIISKMGPVASVVAESWRDLALSSSQTIARRIGALRGLAAIGANARSTGRSLARLLDDPQPAIRTAAQATLYAMRDPSVVARMVAECRPSADNDRWAPDCLIDIAHFGPAVETYGAPILDLLHSRGGMVRAAAATTLGMIGYHPATPELIAGLRSDDWRVVFASARSLGWLRSTDAEHALSDVRDHHWLRAVRTAAARALLAIRGQAPSTPALEWGFLDGKSENPFDFQIAPFDREDSAGCTSHSWRWRNGEVAAVKKEAPDPTFRALQEKTGLRDLAAYHEVAEGHFLGTDSGEFGGDLWFQRTDGARVKLYDENIQDIDVSANGIIALTGIAHMFTDYGYVLSIRPGQGGYSATPRLVLPGAPEFMLPAAAGDVLIVTTHGAFVLHGDWRLEEARCESKP